MSVTLQSFLLFVCLGYRPSRSRPQQGRQGERKPRARHCRELARGLGNLD